MSKNSKPLGCFGQFFLGLLLMGWGSIWLLFFGDLDTLECKRLEPSSNQGQCQLTSNNVVLGSNVTTIPIKSLQGAKLKISSGRNTLYRIELLTAEGTVAVTGGYFSGRGSKQQKVEQIRSFVEDPTQVNLNIRQDHRWIGYLFGVAFGGVGVLFVLSAPLKRLVSGRT